ncbi:LOW QUALITY PROTEIN: ectonucleotide pyrophosphatase/phosphodiesterase family member 5-like [Lingula anatina]|uniref:LOW QUALITY PROTEIN: ectonucleotide pyrophosphatase/phosphodiesterase family member 5-like n=1 Tax=Lingula anatina TaxID=7574 RepID=A0A1S3H1F7_LINAN|nr:LOW QUALITY PROTEIN: ectonucleotide pyrophosphatase/phosphodiesterase family member 5-like [Lingula anatina]|eukprot:XP_013379843.2 LOW QUALITY PROTEIN: ectonucleotide pyrophosphatase/phosphodiesterase family member 5-like [Lingula anatina]
MGLFQVIYLFLSMPRLIMSVICHEHIPRLLIVSYDGFRWNYLTRTQTPNFDYLIEKGVKAKWIKNVFPTVTFPNHYTIVTGLYPESHGIVGNTMYDPAFKENLYLETIDTEEQSKNVEKWVSNKINIPIWLENQKESSKRHSGSIMWPLSEVPVDGQLPKKFVDYNQSTSTSLQDRIDTIVDWFLDEVEPINLGLLYYHEPDNAGHISGPESENVTNMISFLDSATGYLIEKLKAANLFDSINIILTSDHGMTAVSDERVIYLDKYANPMFYQLVGYGAFGNILPVEGKEEEVYQNLTKVPHLHVYLKEDVPEDYHYKNNRRTQPILVELELGWYFCPDSSEKLDIKGSHGYNNSFPDMHPYFIAHGPAFKEGFVSEEFNSVDIYSLMCALLEIKPSNPVNGSLDKVKHLLRGVNSSMDTTLLTYALAIVFVTTIAGVFSISACRHQHRYNKVSLCHSRTMKTNVSGMESLDSCQHLLKSLSDDEL